MCSELQNINNLSSHLPANNHEQQENGIYEALNAMKNSTNLPLKTRMKHFMKHGQHSITSTQASDTNSNDNDNINSIGGNIHSLSHLLLHFNINIPLRELLLNERERKMSEYIPLISNCIQEICEISTNDDFIIHCLQLLNIEHVNDVSLTIQHLLHQSMNSNNQLQ